jgi:hypothetical protein
MQDSYKTRAMDSVPKHSTSFAPGIAGYPTKEPTQLTKSEPEIFLAVNYLTCAIEKLAVKLGPVMRQPCPQELCKDGVASLQQSELGRILQENINRMNLHISIIKELNDRTCL